MVQRESDNVQASQEKDARNSNLLRLLDLELPHHRYRQDQYRNVGEKIQYSRGQQESLHVNTEPVARAVPVQGGQIALENTGDESAEPQDDAHGGEAVEAYFEFAIGG